MIILTGTDGFIGKNILEMFEGKTKDILTVDFNSEIDPFQFLKRFQAGHFKDLDTIIHNGACSDTTCGDPYFIMKRNFEYSLSLFKECLKQNVRLIYASSASVYGDGPFSESSNKTPKNLYALSKSMFDDYVGAFSSNAVGLRYFNVYGKYEETKGNMASVVYKFFNQKKDGKIKLFENSDRFLRDFIHIDDICSLTSQVYENRNISGIFNIGTGKERSFQDIASIFVDRYDVEIEYVRMPDILKGKYQKYTKSDNVKIGSILPHKYLSLEDGVNKYLDYLESQ
jgi:ADP-L-glycero-D-manno-heptose 6-epimerase